MTKELKSAMLYMKMGELRQLCLDYNLPKTGKKNALIERILHFVKTGNVLKEKAIPAISKAVPGKIYPLTPGTLILKGAYKNDLKTRLFFKKLIGDYFHFTAFGIDWTHERWMKGKPPTYQEFADMWKKEYKRRKDSPADPKKEWAYINFVQRLIKKDPGLSRSQIMNAWKKERDRQAKKAYSLIQKLITK